MEMMMVMRMAMHLMMHLMMHLVDPHSCISFYMLLDSEI
jgi:hypothetical protein